MSEAEITFNSAGTRCHAVRIDGFLVGDIVEDNGFQYRGTDGFRTRKFYRFAEVWKHVRELHAIGRLHTSQTPAIGHKPLKAVVEARKEAEKGMAATRAAVELWAKGVREKEWGAFAGQIHSDNAHVSKFAEVMKAKLRRKTLQGFGGWDRKDECTAGDLTRMLCDHIHKGDPLDVALFAMMLHQRGERIETGIACEWEA